MIQIRHCASPIGEILLAAEGASLTGLWFFGQKRFPAGLTDLPNSDAPVLLAAQAWLNAYFEGRELPEMPPLAPKGTAFQQQVWALLREIPRGETRTYGQLAALLGMPGGAQAVGAAVGCNPISILIPCHRVVGTGGRLVGYAGGLKRKQFLLDLEAPL